MSQLIFLKPKGGLGNQLFQYAAALTFKTLGGHIFIFPTAANKHSGRDYRPLFHGHPTDILIFTEHSYVQQDGFEFFDPKNFPYNSITLDGYFQNYPSIKSSIPAIRTLFTQTTEYEEYAFLHVRRGDYLQYSNIHYILPQAYYESALALLNHDKILVFSDDPSWCATQPWLAKYTIVNEPDEMSALTMMSSCKKGAIIANSTFSWWGALLSSTDTVFYPEKWISCANPDLFPENWTRVMC
jgi:hypothetical protein